MTQYMIINPIYWDIATSILRRVPALNAPDCWMTEDFLRSLVWDRLHQRAYSSLPEDIGVI
jgi:hypothetical protein